ncbi:ParB/RepB/Spo0J family partition protein [Desulfurivibrio alkaliphilus]|uniref:ParB-like partition protein n=1 Tax=Desulfurivibrio alkaliphilus (strain DSM 19089 / UNIQEM U267 / AHT2) TaxID=589865 RepID=D6Z560_DESAT|nr:ParB/RepB/Spo0J family partition protein [Desulfurivibrio alkaliphilus]ADH86685.1 parB-like partition protein [Desulfurivibrio alkaliphilus AHT 2]
MVKRNPLGKGLGALLPSHDEDGKRPYLVCPLQAIVPNPHQPRKKVDDGALAQLAESIREKGVLLPLVVRRLDDERYEIIAGERRWRAAGLAGLAEVPVLIKDVSPQDQLELALVENIQRQDLNPLEEAEAYLRLVQEYGLTQEEVARRVGKERSTVANALRINQLPDFAKDDLAAERISMGHARVLLGLQDEQQMRQLRDEIISKGLSVRQAEEAARRRKKRSSAGGGKSNRSSSHGLPESYCRALAAELGRNYDTRVKIVQNGKRGKLEIEYYSPDDLERLIGLLQPDSK